MGFKLVRTDTAEPCKIQLPLGKHLIGRGKLLDCEDKRVSRNHGELEVINDKVIIKALHQNPCFLIKKGVPETQILNQNCVSDISNGDKFGLLPDTYWFELLYCVDIDNETEGQEPTDTTAQVKQEPNEDASSEKTENMSGDDGDKNDHDHSEVLDLNLNETLENNVPGSPSLLGTESEQATQQYTSEKSPARREPDQIDPPAESNVPDVKQEPEDSTSPPKRPHSPEDGSDDGVKKVKTEPETRQDPDSAQAGPSNDQMGSNSDDNKDQKLQPPSTTAPGRERCIYGANCYRRNPQHKAQFSHPADADWGAGAQAACPYGAACRKRDPRHWRDHSHPPGVAPPPHHPPPPVNVAGKKQRKRKPKRYSSDDDDDATSGLIVQGKRVRKTTTVTNTWSGSESEKEEDPYGTDESDEWQPTSDMTDSQIYSQDFSQV